MNQQETNLLFEQFIDGYESSDRWMGRAAFSQAAAEIRRLARQETLDEVAQMAKDAAEHASAAALKLHSEKKLLEGQKTVFRALYLHFTSFANRIENMSALAQPNGSEGER